MQPLELSSVCKRQQAKDWGGVDCSDRNFNHKYQRLKIVCARVGRGGGLLSSLNERGDGIHDSHAHLYCSKANDWQVPDDIKDLLSKAWSAPLHTKIIEDSFNVLEDCRTNTKSETLSKMNLQATLIESHLLQTYGYESLKQQVVHQTEVPAKLPQNLWTADALPFSLGGHEGLKSMSSDEGWKSASPQTAANLPLFSESLLHCQEVGWVGAFSTWLALLVPVGSILVDDLRKKRFYVMHKSEHGILLWPVHYREMTTAGAEQSKKCYSLKFAPGTKVIFRAITTVEKIRIAFIKVRSPLACSTLPICKDLAGKLVLEHDASHELVHAAALKGFSGMTLTHLKLLYVKLAVDTKSGERKPTTVSQYLHALLKWCLPKHSDDQIAAIIKERGNGAVKPLHSVLEELDHVELCQDLLNDEDMDAIKAKKKRESKRQNVHKPAPQASASSGSNAPATAVVQQQAVESRHAYGVKIDWTNFAPKDLKQFIPPGKTKDVFLQRELKLASRWRAKYPNSIGPKSFSMVYYDEAIEKMSVQECIRWLWESHRQETGAECPFDIGALWV
eukprot:2835254-Amphidinium_carterae.1